jgi:hypothetical protein
VIHASPIHVYNSLDAWGLTTVARGKHCHPNRSHPHTHTHTHTHTAQIGPRAMELLGGGNDDTWLVGWWWCSVWTATESPSSPLLARAETCFLPLFACFFPLAKLATGGAKPRGECNKCYNWWSSRCGRCQSVREGGMGGSVRAHRGVGRISESCNQSIIPLRVVYDTGVL